MHCLNPFVLTVYRHEFRTELIGTNSLRTVTSAGKVQPLTTSKLIIPNGVQVRKLLITTVVIKLDI